VRTKIRHIFFVKEQSLFRITDIRMAIIGAT